jgi:hypothetical protein
MASVGNRLVRVEGEFFQKSNRSPIVLRNNSEVWSKVFWLGSSFLTVLQIFWLFDCLLCNFLVIYITSVYLAILTLAY